MANRGTVVRVGDTVRRPVRPGSEAVWALLEHLEAVGFDEAPRFLGTDHAGREVLSYIPGEVGVPPFPSWVVTEGALAEAARLVRRFHEAVAGFAWQTVPGWSEELMDPGPGQIVCHNDVCPENVVFREGMAVGLVDFEFAAPGRPIWDVAMAARMWGPMTHPRLRVSWPDGLDAAARMAGFARAYGLPGSSAGEFVDTLVATRQVAMVFVRRRAASGEPAFAEWEGRAGEARVQRADSWVVENRRRFFVACADALSNEGPAGS